MYRFVFGSILGVAAFATPSRAGALITPRGADLRQCAFASACADRVVVGHVTGVEKDHVKAKPIPAVPSQVTYQIFRLAVSETLAGDKAVTEIRIGGPVSDAPPVRGPDAEQYPDPVAKDAEGLYFLARHHTGEFYTIVHFVPGYYKETYGRDTKDARRYLGLLTDPIVSLRDKKPEDRLATAVLLLMRHQAYRGPKWKPIPDEENKLILAALDEVNWGDDADAPLTPVRVVRAVWRESQVRAMEAGKVFKEPVLPAKTQAEEGTFLREWVRRNRATIRIERNALE